MSTEKKVPIPARVYNASQGGHVAGAVDIIDDNKGKTQATINAEVDDKFNQMDDEIEALEKQDVIPVDSLPTVSSADPKKIYRVVGSTSYTDYMVNSTGDGWKELATFEFPGIDNEPTAGSDNLVKSGGVAKIYEITNDNTIYNNGYFKTSTVNVGDFINISTNSKTVLVGYFAVFVNLKKGDSVITDFTNTGISSTIVNNALVLDKDKNIITSIIPLSNTTFRYDSVEECRFLIHTLKGKVITVLHSSSIYTEDAIDIKNSITSLKTYTNIVYDDYIKLNHSNVVALPFKKGEEFVCFINSESDNIRLAINQSVSGSYSYLGIIRSTDDIIIATVNQNATLSYLINESTDVFEGRVTIAYKPKDYHTLVDNERFNNKINALCGEYTETAIDGLQYYAGYVDTNGVIHNVSGEPSSTWNYTNMIEVSQNYLYIWKGSLYGDVAGIALYDENGDFVRSIVSGKPYGQNDHSFYIFTSSQEKYIRLCSYETLSTFFKEEVVSNTKILQVLINDNRITALENKTEETDFYNSFRGFYKFGVIGDSLSVGHMDNPIDPSRSLSRNIMFSWPQLLARKNGQVALNFGLSGVTAGSWWNASKCREELIKSENYCQCYIVGLGVNDQSTTIGDFNDVDWSDYNNNANTFIGNYVKILQLIHSLTPESIIFILAPMYPYESGVFVNIRNAILSIESNETIHSWGTVFAIDLAEYDYVTKYLANKYYYSYHYMSPGYAIIGDMIEMSISEVMNKNAPNSNIFKTVGFIPYGNNLTPIL